MCYLSTVPFAAIVTVTLTLGSVRSALAASSPGTELKRVERSKAPVYVMGGVGLAALGVGLSLIGIAESKRSDAKTLSLETKHACAVSDPAPQGSCKDLASAASSGDAFGNIGIAAVAVGVTAVAGGVAYWFLSAPRAETPSARAVRVLPTASTTGGGVVLVGSF